MYIFKGWSRKEKVQFLISLMLTIAFAALMIFGPMLLESVIRPHEGIAVYSHQTT